MECKGSQKELQHTKQRENDSQYADSQDANDHQESDHDPPKSDAIVIPFGWMDKERTQDSLLRERTGSDLSDPGSNVFKDDFQKTHLPSLGQDSALVSRGAYQENDVDSYRDDDVASRGRKPTGMGNANNRKHARSLMNDLETWSEEDVVADSFEEMTLLEKGKDHAITVQSPSSGTASVTSPGSGSTESTESSSGFSTVRESSEMWCECLRSESIDLECRECSRNKGHERWCTLKTGVCPDCGKYKKEMADFRSRGSTLFSSSKVKTGISSTSQTCTAGHEVGGLESRAKKNGKRNKKKKQSKKSIREAEKLLQAKEEADRRSRITSRRSYRVETKINSHLPTVDPDIHRQAYIMALGDARLRKWRGDSYTFHEAVNRTSFSYFPLWRNPQPVTSDIHIGIRKPDWKGTGKLRDSMRHVFGTIHMSDYYPSGKAFRKVSEENA